MVNVPPPAFDDAFRHALADLVAWRRDVRRFRKSAVDRTLVERLVELACLAPSVGNSQPWRFVTVDAPERRQAIIENFRTCNRDALAAYDGERAQLYARLKLEGLETAPVHIAALCDESTAQGHGLGQRTMPETLRYSTVTAVHTLWLAARAHGLGVGWVSILDPAGIGRTLATPPTWSFIAYLCLGWPEENHLDPELQRAGWQNRVDGNGRLIQR
ncbi:MAG: 5,6-dimethylbenzimidazole synthase [Rhodospirillales bacterium]|nr:5,6-dimethylbenzimidazole synthase [Rhodospirillales bacterium]